MFNSKYRKENITLKSRISDLEEIICPNASHTWKQIDSKLVHCGFGMGDELYESIYKCQKCGKIKYG